jgi:hypothetical protein
MCSLISQDAYAKLQHKEATVDTHGLATQWVAPVVRATHPIAMPETADTPLPETLALPMVEACTTAEAP